MRLAGHVFDGHLREQGALAVIEGQLVLGVDVNEVGSHVQ
jgi:hypothetical protein